MTTLKTQFKPRFKLLTNNCAFLERRLHSFTLQSQRRLRIEKVKK